MGLAKVPEYNCWRHLKSGNKTCERWRDSYAAFLADVGPRPSPKHKLERLDKAGNFEPGNCQWTTTRDASASKRCYACKETKPLEAFGSDKSRGDGRELRCLACKRAKDRDGVRVRRRLGADERQHRYVARYPAVARAHGAVQRAMKSGELVRKPCEECGERRSHAHHDDYAKPLEVRWLCPIHHKAWHRANGRGANLEAA